MSLRHACLRPLLPVAAAAALSGCVSFGIRSPEDRTIYPAPATVRLEIQARPSMSGLAVTRNGTDVTGQLTSVTATEAVGSLSLTEGTHRIAATADVPCWYCSPHMRYGIEVCVRTAAWPASVPTMTSLLKRNGQGWAKSGAAAVGVAPDAGTPAMRWQLLRASGIGQAAGLIRSIEDTCLCMKSMADAGGTPVGLAYCDASDRTQLWEALEIPNTGGHYRFQNLGRSVSGACLTRSAGDALVQAGCQDTDDQLWKVRDNTTGAVVAPF
jgi:hypothetical protein